MAGEKKERLDVSSLSIILGVSFVICTLLWIILENLFKKDNPNEITWVG